MKGRALTWTAACALVVLAARALAYQLAPRPTVVGVSLEEATAELERIVTGALAGNPPTTANLAVPDEGSKS